MSVIADLTERRKALRAELEAEAAPKNDDGEIRSMTDDESTAWDAKAAEVAKLDERISELQEQETREAAANKHHLEVGTAEVEQRVQVTNEPNPVYRPDDTVRSFFKDLATVQTNNVSMGSTIPEARDRLARAQETRAGDMTTVAGAGGEFAPPAWLIEEFVSLARAGRVTADLCNKQVLPSGVSSVNLPKVATGTATGVQATQNSALTDTAMTTTSVSSGITTVGGLQIVSLQLLQQSGIPFDRVILSDLAAAYATNVDTQVLYGAAGSGEVAGLVGVATNTAFTSAAPAPASVTNANSLYYTVGKAEATAWAALYNRPNAIVMHPRRWSWILGSVDSNARPFVVPRGPQFNGLATAPNEVPAEGFAGSFGDLDVYVDPNIKIAANSTTNQDEIYILRGSDLWLYESPVQTASFDATYAANASVLFRILGYIAFIPTRRTGAVQSIRGTGLVAP